MNANEGFPASRRRPSVGAVVVFACMFLFGAGIAGMAWLYVRVPADRASADGFRTPDGVRVVSYSSDPSSGLTTVVVRATDDAAFDRLASNGNWQYFVVPPNSGKLTVVYDRTARTATIVRKIYP